MKITRTSPISNKEVTLDLDVTEAQMEEFDSPDRRKIQEIFPNLNPGDREFIKTGISQEEWLELFGTGDD